MNSRKWIVSALVVCLAAASAIAADASPAGLWKWTVHGRQGGQGFEQTVKLEYRDGKLSGIMPGRSGQYSVPDTPISDASFQDGQIKFAVTRELNGQKFTTKYEGKIEGDTIKGTFERGGANLNGLTKSDWLAKRS